MENILSASLPSNAQCRNSMQDQTMPCRKEKPSSQTLQASAGIPNANIHNRKVRKRMNMCGLFVKR